MQSLNTSQPMHLLQTFNHRQSVTLSVDLTDFSLEESACVIKAENDSCGIWRPQVVMHRKCYTF